MIPTRQLYIFMGPPGCGKGTLSAMCVQQLGWAQLSTGNMCRKHIMEGTQMGKTMDFIIKSGKLISDDLIVDMVKNELDQVLDHYDHIILDGFPRTEPQAKLLFELIRAKHLALTIIKFNVDHQELLNRLATRLVCSNKECQAVYSTKLSSALLPKVEGHCDRCGAPLIKREDDRADVVEKRLKEYDKQADQVLGYFAHQGLPLLSLSVSKPIQEVFFDFKKLIQGAHDNN